MKSVTSKQVGIILYIVCLSLNRALPGT